MLGCGKLAFWVFFMILIQGLIEIPTHMSSVLLKMLMYLWYQQIWQWPSGAAAGRQVQTVRASQMALGAYLLAAERSLNIPLKCIWDASKVAVLVCPSISAFKDSEQEKKDGEILSGHQFPVMNSSLQISKSEICASAIPGHFLCKLPSLLLSFLTWLLT